MFPRIASVLVPLSACVLAFPSSAQTGSGTLTGTVSDVSGAALQGVRITLEPGGYTTLTNSTGQYTLPGIGGGQYTLQAAYAGFANASHPVTVATGQILSQNLSLTVAGNNQSVTVYAPREGGELEAISRTFNAPNIINVLPADVITSLPTPT